MLTWLKKMSLLLGKSGTEAAERRENPVQENRDGSPEFDGLPAIADAIMAAKEIVILTGAGVSAESGIPTFREGATGLWNKIDPEEVASIRGLEADPGKVWAWHARMKQLIDEREPNSGHLAIAELSKRLANKRVTLITQNIDGYHQHAGSDRVFELHGSIHRLRCHRNCSHYELWLDAGTHPDRCPNCGALMRPDVVLFGEPLNEDLLDIAEAATRHADVFFSVGTSSSVQPAAGLPIMAKLTGALVVEINPNETSFSEHADYSIRSSAGQFFPELLARYIGSRYVTD